MSVARFAFHLPGTNVVSLYPGIHGYLATPEGARVSTAELSEMLTVYREIADNESTEHRNIDPCSLAIVMRSADTGEPPENGAVGAWRAMRHIAKLRRSPPGCAHAVGTGGVPPNLVAARA